MKSDYKEFASRDAIKTCFPDSIWKDNSTFKDIGKIQQGHKFSRVKLLSEKYKIIDKKDPEYLGYVGRVILGIFLTAITCGAAYWRSNYVRTLFDDKKRVIIALGQAVPDDHYQISNVQTRFLQKAESHKCFYTQESLNLFKDRAEKIIELVFSKNSPFKPEFELIKKGMQDKLYREPTLEELKAKIYSLALRTQQALICQLNMKPLDREKKPGKLAPHLRLFDKTALAIPYQSENGRELIIQLDPVNKGGFNRISKIYSINSSQIFAQRSLVVLEQFEMWNREVSIHQTLVGIPHILSITKKIVVRDDHGKVVHASVLMDLLGRDLSSVKISQAQARIRYLKTLLEVVSNLKDEGIIHGDIKLENILFKAQENQVYLTDFGLASYIKDTPYVYRSLFNLPLDVYKDFDLESFTETQKYGIDCFATGLVAYELKYGRELSNAYARICLSLERLTLCYLNNSNDFISSFKRLDNLSYNDPLLKEFSSMVNQNQKLKGKALFDKIYKETFIPRIEQEFYRMLEKCTTDSSDLEDALIMNLLNPDCDQRWTAEKALKYINVYLSAS